MVISRLTEIFLNDPSEGQSGSASGRNRSNKIKSESQLEDQQDAISCQACRFIGGGGLTALGLYVLAQANGLLPESTSNKLVTRRLFAREAGPRNLPANFIGLVVISIGLARLMEWHVPGFKSDDSSSTTD